MHKLKYLTISIILVVSLSLAGPSFNVSASPLAVASAPPLGTASTFSVLAALSMSAAGAGTFVGGDLGLSPGLAISRTGPWTVLGTEYFGPLSLAATAQTDALGAWNNMAGQTSDGTWSLATSPVPGVWTDASSPVFSGTLTLTGTPTDVWVFQLTTDFTFSGSVVLAGGARACNVFWQIGRDATIASGSTFVGTLIAERDVTLVSGATVDGRIMSLTGSLTTDGNSITGPSCPALAPTVTPTVTTTTPPTSTVTTTPGPGTPSVTPTVTLGPGTPTATTTPVVLGTATATLGPGTPSATPGGPTATRRAVSGLPNTGGAPIQRNQDFPWSLVILVGSSALALGLGIRAYRRSHQPKQ